MLDVRRIIILLLCALWLPLAAAAETSYPSLWLSRDPNLQKTFTAFLDMEFAPEFWKRVEQKRIAIVLVDITDEKRPRVAGFNGDVMMYAASLPKIAILLGALVEVERGNMRLDQELRASLARMIRESSNGDATAILRKVGFENLARILQSERYRLYDPAYNGGLWIGRDYSGKDWRGDPLHGISHGATAMQVARFYYMGVTGRLVAPELIDDLLDILSAPAIDHMFVKGLSNADSTAVVYRKSGTWKQLYADSAVVAGDRYRYIIAAINEHPGGADELVRLIGAVEETMHFLYPGR